LAAASDSGVKGDRITNVTKPTITGKGAAGDKVRLRDGGKVIGTATVAKDGTWSVTAADALAAGVHNLTATETGKTGTSAASAALELTIKTSAPKPSGLSFAVAADKGNAGDTFTAAGKGEAGDRVTLFDGKIAIGSRKVGAGGTWSITTATPLAVGAHSLSASEVDVAGNKSAASPAQRLVVAHAAANAVTFFGSAGTDRFTGGAGNDVFRFSAAELGNTDIVKGGGGNDQLRLTSAGTVRVNGVSGVEAYVLANGADNVLTLTGANFAGVTRGTITVTGGNGADMLSEAGVSATDKAVLKGGIGADTLVAGRNAVLNGGPGKDRFELTVPGAPTNLDHNTIADFTHGTDKIVLSEKGFALGTAPKAAILFTADKNGSFTNPNQRFAYDTTNGDLFYDAHGNAAHSSRLEIATLTNHPNLTTGDITFAA
jgi:Ca2+-binding RTX toxin-like protein